MVLRDMKPLLFLRRSLCHMAFAAVLIFLSPLSHAQFTVVDAGNMDFGNSANDTNSDSTIIAQDFTWANTDTYVPPDGSFTSAVMSPYEETDIRILVNHPDVNPELPNFYGYQINPIRPATYTATMDFDSPMTLDPMHVMTLTVAGGIDVEQVIIRAFNGSTQLDLAGANPFDPDGDPSAFDPDNFNLVVNGDPAYAPTVGPNAADMLALEVTGFGKHLVAPDQTGSLPMGYPTENYVVDTADNWPNVDLTWANITGATTTPLTITHFTWEFAHQGTMDAYDNNSISYNASMIRLDPIPEPGVCILFFMTASGFLLQYRVRKS